MSGIDSATILTVLLGLVLIPAWKFLLGPLYRDLFLSGELKRYCSGYWRAAEPDIRKQADNAKAHWHASDDGLMTASTSHASITLADELYWPTVREAEAGIEELKAMYQSTSALGSHFRMGLIHEGVLLREIVDKAQRRRELIADLTDRRVGY